MPLYQFRLEAQDGSGHFRTGRINEESEERARLVLEERERDWAAFRLTPEHEADLRAEYGAGSEDLPARGPLGSSEEDNADFRALQVRHRAWLNLHRQEQPYKLVSLAMIEGSEGAA